MRDLKSSSGRRPRLGRRRMLPSEESKRSLTESASRDSVRSSTKRGKHNVKLSKPRERKNRNQIVRLRSLSRRKNSARDVLPRRLAKLSVRPRNLRRIMEKVKRMR